MSMKALTIHDVIGPLPDGDGIDWSCWTDPFCGQEHVRLEEVAAMVIQMDVRCGDPRLRRVKLLDRPGISLQDLVDTLKATSQPVWCDTHTRSTRTLSDAVSRLTHGLAQPHDIHLQNHPDVLLGYLLLLLA